MTATLAPPWDLAHLDAVCKVLAKTDFPGLTWTQIERLFPEAGVREVQDGSSKYKRLYATLWNTQYKQRGANCIIRFIRATMKPSRYIDQPGQFEALRDELNEALAFKGLHVDEAGELRRGAHAKTLAEAAAIAGRLRSELTRRQVHAEVVKYCREELIRKSLFHAMFEACKGVAERIRQLTGQTSDGAELIDTAFSTKSGDPRLKVNSYKTATDISDHKGLGNLIRGVFGTFRNDGAHTPRLVKVVNEQDALDLFCTLSYIHRRLDDATSN